MGDEKSVHANVMPAGLRALMERAGAAPAPAPVERWRPACEGSVDIRIRSDGSWHYRGSEIRRERLVRLFASVLKREGERFFLVTPVEKMEIAVDDAPFVAVEMESTEANGGQALVFRTNVGDVVTAGPEHRLRFVIDPETEGIKPYLAVRAGLEALLARPVTHELMAHTEDRPVAGTLVTGIASAGAFFEIAPAIDADGL